MFVIGITGGIASGKSTLTELLKPQAAAVVDADEIAREIIAPGTGVFEIILERFGTGILDKEGVINRPELGRLIFGNKKDLAFIDDLTHPPIITKLRKKLRELNATVGPEDIVLLRVPLMVEKGLTGLADLCVVVTANEETRIERMGKHRSLSETEARQRIDAQLTDSERVKWADIVVENNGDPEDLKKAAHRILKEVNRKVRERVRG